METLDPQAVNLAKAIRQTESGGNFQASGKSGEYGAYQFTSPTWEATSKKFGVNVPLQQATPEQQNEVAYKQIKEWKDKGHNVGEIASMWNAGVGRPNAYLENNTGTNDYGVHYDTPAYAKKVATAYQTIKNGGQSGEQSQTPTTDANGYVTSLGDSLQRNSEQSQESSLGSELGNRINDLSSGVSTIVHGTGHGTGLVSGLLQGAGAVAGAVGDVVNKGIELIPGVKALEGVIGKGIGKLAHTPAGQAIVKSMHTFAEKHPELSKDLGAGFNIITALPILDGLGTIGKVALDSGSVALKDAALKTFTEDVSQNIGKNATQVTKDMFEKNIIPDVKNGAYDVTDALEKLKALRKTITVDSDMRRTDEIKSALQSLSGKPVKSNPLGNVIKGVTNKLPVANFVGDAIGNKAEGITTGILKRTVKGASRVGAKQGAKKVAGLVGGAVAQKANQSTP